MKNRTSTIVLAAGFFGFMCNAADADVLFDSGNFESSNGYTLGTLKGQVAGSAYPWKLATTVAGGVGASAVTVENNVAYQGSQAVQFSRSSTDKDTYAYPYLSSAIVQRYVNVSWAMDVTPGASNDPFFGVFSYNGNDSLAYGGVDATTGAVQYSQAAGGLMTTSMSVGLGVWNNFDMQLDYTLKTATLYVNGSAAITTPFIHLADTGFTDADLTSFASKAGEVGSGTVYFDNYQVNTTAAAYTVPRSLTWLNLAGTGDGSTWDVGTSQNFNDGLFPTTFQNTDNVTFNDTNAGHYAVKISGMVNPNSVLVNNSVGDYTFTGSGGIAGSGGLTKMGTSALTLSTSNTYTGGTSVAAGTLNLTTSTAFPTNTSLTIAAGATVIATTHAGSSPTVVSVSTLNNSGLLDLTNNALVVGSTASFAAVNAQVTATFNNGSWNGSSGITSSTAAQNSRHTTALGLIPNDTGDGFALYGSGTILGLFDGANPAVDQVLVKYTYYGDTDLNGVVDGSDYSRIDNGFLTKSTGWFNGDFNYDGVVNGSDYTLADNAFNTQTGSLAAVVASSTAEIASSQAVGSVPEPGCVTALAICAISLIERRQRVRL